MKEPVNFEKIWKTVAHKRTDMVEEWLQSLQVCYNLSGMLMYLCYQINHPELAARAEELGGLSSVLQMAIDHRKNKSRSCLQLQDWTRRGCGSTSRM